MNASFDPEEQDSPEDHLFDDPNSMTWGSADPDFDDMLRERLGPMPVMPTPPYAFERVLVAGRRRRARKVWSGAAAAAFVVMAGTAGTTVAVSGGGSGGAAVAANAPTTSATLSVTSASPFASTTPSPLASATSQKPSAAASTASPSDGSSTPVCASDSFKLTVSTAPNSSGSSADELIIVLKNTSGHACTTFGYPGLELETQSGQFQSTTVNRIQTSSVQHLTVQANQSISTTATFTAAANAGSTAGAGCTVPSYYLAVIPPDQKIQIVQPIDGGPVTVCGDGALDTSPFVMGSSGNLND